MDGCWKSTELSGATLLAAAVLRASGMSTELACAEAVKLTLCLAHDGWQVGKGAVDVQF